MTTFVKNFFLIFFIFIVNEISFFFKFIKRFLSNKGHFDKIKFYNIYNKKNFLDYKINQKNLILVESLIIHPAYFLKNLIIANHLRKITGNDIILLVNQSDIYARKLSKSFGVKYVILNSEPNFLIRFYNFFKILIIFQKIKKIKNFLKLKYQKINLGKIVYDDILRIQKVGTYESIDYKIIETTFKFLNSIAFYNKIFKKFKVKILLQDEIQFYPASSLFQCALNNKIKCFIKEGQRRYISLKKVVSINDCFENKSKFSRKLIQKLFLSKSKNKIIRSGKIAMKNRINGLAKENDINDARHFKKGIQISKKKLCKNLNWDHNKPIGIIFANDLTDGVFTNKWSLFKDNLSWLIFFMKTINKNNNVNWLIKEHPSDKKNFIKKGTKYFYLKINKNFKHVKMLPNNINAKSLHKIVDFVFCSHGSAGLEFPFSKIPCVTTSDSLYENLGFTNEYKNLNELKKIINNPKKLKKINKKSYDLLCIFLDLYINRTKIKIGMPDYDPNFENIDHFNKKILLHLKNNSFYENKFHKALSDQVKNNYKHTTILDDLKDF